MKAHMTSFMSCESVSCEPLFLKSPLWLFSLEGKYNCAHNQMSVTEVILSRVLNKYWRHTWPQPCFKCPPLSFLIFEVSFVIVFESIHDHIYLSHESWYVVHRNYLVKERITLQSNCIQANLVQIEHFLTTQAYSLKLGTNYDAMKFGAVLDPNGVSDLWLLYDYTFWSHIVRSDCQTLYCMKWLSEQ